MDSRTKISILKRGLKQIAELDINLDDVQAICEATGRSPKHVLVDAIAEIQAIAKKRFLRLYNSLKRW